MIWKLYFLIKMYRKLIYWRKVQNYKQGNKIMSRKYIKIFGFSHSFFRGVTMVIEECRVFRYYRFIATVEYQTLLITLIKGYIHWLLSKTPDEVGGYFVVICFFSSAKTPFFLILTRASRGGHNRNLSTRLIRSN